MQGTPPEGKYAYQMLQLARLHFACAAPCCWLTRAATYQRQLVADKRHKFAGEQNAPEQPASPVATTGAQFDGFDEPEVPGNDWYAGGGSEDDDDADLDAHTNKRKRRTNEEIFKAGWSSAVMKTDLPFHTKICY